MSRPHELAYEFLWRAKENGVTVESGVKITDITTKSDRVTGITTDDGRNIKADEVICAAGPWNIDIAESVDIDIPVEHTLAPIVNLEPESPLEYDLPAINHFESPYAFHRRSRNEILIGHNPGYENGTRYEPGVVSEQVPTEIRDKGLDLLVKLLPKWQDAEVVDEWVGVRSITPDGNPVVGWTGLKGFNIAAFHTSGIQLAPAVGRMIAQQLINNEPTSYYDMLSISRFDGYEDWRP
jgi:glycine/D-amino acid oxidase-like deaminating enzyme